MSIGAGAAVLAACVVVPIPLPEDTVLAGKPVKSEDLAFLAAGSTTRDEVVARFGQPDVFWEDKRIYAYDWDMRQGVLLWAVGGYPQAAGGIADIPKHYLFLIEFDEAWRVERFARTTRPLTKSYAEFLLEWEKGGDEAWVAGRRALP
ncbi:MAG: hypothetical protein U0572_01365 [Phycisphaerales bacterium]